MTGAVGTFSSSRGISFEEPTDDDMAARRTISNFTNGLRELPVRVRLA